MSEFTPALRRSLMNGLMAPSIPAAAVMGGVTMNRYTVSDLKVTCRPLRNYDAGLVAVLDLAHLVQLRLPRRLGSAASDERRQQVQNKERKC